MMNSTSLHSKKINWTKYVYQRQLSVFKDPTSKCPIIKRQKRHEPLRTFKLSEIVASPSDLEHVFLGFSICGNYLYSYIEIPGESVTIWPGTSDYEPLGASGLTYEFYLWRFVPGKKLQEACRTKLFGGESFADCIRVHVEQRRDSPDVCIVIGSTSGTDRNTITRTLWHTVFFIPPRQPKFLYQFNFHVLYALFSDFRQHDRYLAVGTCDELILLDLKAIFYDMEKMYETLNEGKFPSGYSRNESCMPVLLKNVGDISKAKLDLAYYFPYVTQTLQWCAKNCEANLNATCFGLSDYHLLLDTLSNDHCIGCVFALYDVDTTERYYFESMFTFDWDLSNGCIELLTAISTDVTDRSKEPGKQQKAFNALRKELFGKITFPAKEQYQLNNFSVLHGYSLQWLMDSTGHIALTL